VLTVSKGVLGAMLTLATALATQAHAQPTLNRTVAPNDNVRAAGVVSQRVLKVRLVAGRGKWRPEGPESPELDVAAFAEDGGPLLAPGPMLRVTTGTAIAVTVLNTLDGPLFVHGLVTRPAQVDSVLAVPPGQEREVRFVPGAPGTYHYWATTGNNLAIAARRGFDSQLGGALIVDEAGAPPSDRVFVISEWRIRPGPPATSQPLFTINGQSWPFTERLAAVIGQTVHWRWVNLTSTSHPMHLHGFYFSVAGTGSGLAYNRFAADQQPLVVTQNMSMGSTMEMSWTPDRPGQWLLHCHMLGHVTPDMRFWSPDAAQHTGHGDHDISQTMAGMVMGISVTGDAKTATASSQPIRRLTLAAYRRSSYWGLNDAYAFALEDGDKEPTADAISVPGPPIILTRGQPVEITIRNRMPEPTSVHWHGIELESYYDGVPGFSGTNGSTTPLIAPGESFVVRFTPPRAGTFIYHTHSHDDHQLASGLYGALIVLEPGQTFDPTVDHVLVIGMTGPLDAREPNRLSIVVNGKGAELNIPIGPQPRLRLKAGVPHRLRLINITTVAEASVSLLSPSGPLEWQPVAKDGAGLPANQQVLRPASGQLVAVGETYDFIVTARSAGPMWLEVRYAPTGMWIQQLPIAVDVPTN
jgi:FtsP/CotA-like multicopper oxidase with cupredoxin domain